MLPIIIIIMEEEEMLMRDNFQIVLFLIEILALLIDMSWIQIEVQILEVLEITLQAITSEIILEL